MNDRGYGLSLVNLIYYTTILTIVMIKGLRLKNFKGIKSGEIELAPLTILLGANNSGKTTVLEALFLAPNPSRRVPYNGGSKTAIEVVHEIHKTLSSEGFAFLLNGYVSKRAEIMCRVNGDDYILQFIKGDTRIYVSTNKETKSPYATNLYGEKIRFFGELGLSSKEYEFYDESLFIDNTLLMNSNLVKAAYGYMEENWAFIINSGICGKVAEEASVLSPEKYKNITIEPFLGRKLAVYVLLEDGTRIRLGDLGEGIQNYVIAKILYEVVRPKVLLWDDVEAHLNPRVLLKLSEWFSNIINEGGQVILTTHSLEAARTIASLSEEKARISLTFLKDGLLKVKELTLNEVDDLLKAGVDVRVAEPLLL